MTNIVYFREVIIYITEKFLMKVNITKSRSYNIDDGSLSVITFVLGQDIVL